MAFHERLLEWVQGLSPFEQRLLALLAVLVGGYLLMKIGISVVVHAMARSRRVDTTLQGFVHAILTAAGWVVIVVGLLVVLGFNVAALLGGLAIGGFILGFALKDTLGNLAAGVLLLFYRPFHVGEAVSIADMHGEVVALGMSLTRIKAADGRIITVPNGSVLSGAIINHTRSPLRRADVLVGISYDDDIDTAIKAILEALPKDPRVLADPAPSVWITDLGDSAVGLQVRPWVRTEHFWQAKTDFHGVVKRALEAAGCTIPYPQRDVHLYAEKAAA